MPDPADTAARAADALLAYWTGAPGQDMLTRDLCRRLADAVERDSPVPLAGLAEADPARAAALVREAVRSASERSPAVRGLCLALAPEPARPERDDARTVVQNVTVTGTSAPTLTVGGNISGGVYFGGPPSEPPKESVPPPRDPGPTPSRETSRGGDAGTESFTILFAAADPSDQARLRLGTEARRVREQLDLAQMRDRISLDLWTAVRPEDFVRALLQARPRVVHFSGHGSGEALAFENDRGLAHPVSTDALKDLFGEFADTVHCVVLNACSTAAQAEAIAEHIPYVIGMSAVMPDAAALAFSAGFYQALGAGCEIPQAFRLACTSVKMKNLTGDHVPVLQERDRTHGSGGGGREGRPG